jgi:hypothetical membrane protein
MPVPTAADRHVERPAPWWALVSSAAAPVLLIGGWTVAATRQPGGFDSVQDTISALAALDATDRWIMTTGLAGLGVCHVVTALGLRPLAVPGRVVLAVGGVATVLVAAYPLPAGGGSSTAHTAVAAVAFGALSVWPALAWHRGRLHARPARAAVGLGAAAVLTGLLGWFGAELALDDGRVGLAERVTAGAQALWPLAAVLLGRRSPGPVA